MAPSFGHQSNQTMQKTTVQDQKFPLVHLAPIGPLAEHEVNITVIYEDAASSQWAREMCAQRFMDTPREHIHTTWWKLNELSEPAVLAGAVSTAMRADLIVVAVRATEGFPLPFYVWVGSWLPHRMPETGTLVGLITTSKQLGFQRNRAAEYLRAIAGRARMECQITERPLAREFSFVAESDARPRRNIVVLGADGKRTPLHRYTSRRLRMAA